MDKQMIEEMAKVICGACLSVEEPCYMKNQPCGITKKQAEALYNAGYRKIQGAVVLTREEYEKLTTPMLLIKQKPLSQKELYKKFNEMVKYGVIGVDDGIIETIPTRKEIEKETAEKFAERLKTECFDGGIDDKWVAVSFSRLDEICKEIAEGKV